MRPKRKVNRTGTFDSQYCSATSSSKDAAVRSAMPRSASRTPAKAEASLGLSRVVAWDCSNLSFSDCRISHARKLYHSHAFTKYDHHILIGDDSRRSQEKVCRCDVEERNGTDKRVRRDETHSRCILEMETGDFLMVGSFLFIVHRDPEVEGSKLLELTLLR